MGPRLEHTIPEIPQGRGWHCALFWPTSDMQRISVFHSFGLPLAISRSAIFWLCTVESGVTYGLPPCSRAYNTGRQESAWVRVQQQQPVAAAVHCSTGFFRK